MTTFNISQPTISEEQEFVPLETGEYPMIIKEASIGPSAFTNDRGETPEQVSLTWQLDGTKAQQAEWIAAGYRADQRVYQRMSSFFGMNKNKVPSKFYQLVQNFHKQGILPQEFEVQHLTGIRQLVLVEKYIKENGVNKGQWGNRVLSTRPLNGSTQPVAPMSQAVTATQAMTRSSAVNLSDADDIEGWVIPDDLADLNKMTPTEIRDYAATLAKEAKGRFEGRDYATMRPSAVVSAIRSMHAVLGKDEDWLNE